MREDASGLLFFTIEVLNLSGAEGANVRDSAAFDRGVRDSFGPNHRASKLTPFVIAGGAGREAAGSNTADEMDNMRGLVVIFGGRHYEVGFGATGVDGLESATGAASSRRSGRRNGRGRKRRRKRVRHVSGTYARVVRACDSGTDDDANPEAREGDES
jgi:hypothetical protein